MENERMANPPYRIEPRSPALLALLTVGGLRLAQPEPLSAGPRWLVLAIVELLLIPTVRSRRRGLDSLQRSKRSEATEGGFARRSTLITTHD